MTLLCVRPVLYCIIIGLSNGLSPVWQQDSIQNNADLLSLRPLEMIFSETKIKHK